MKTVRSEASEKVFVEANFARLVAAGREGYRKKGRGAVAIGECYYLPSASHTPAQEAGEENLHGFTQCLYIADNDISNAEGWPDSTVARMVSDYDPDKQFVVVFLIGAVAAYKIRLPVS